MTSRTVLITGSSSGIGKKIAESFALSGYSVIINGRDQERLETTLNELRQINNNVTCFRADVSIESEVASLIAFAVNSFGKIDILINNAATVGIGYPVEKYPIELWDKVLETNLRAAFLVSKHIIPQMKKNNWGRIINIGGLSAVNPLPLAVADACSKAGLAALTRVLAAELGPFNISVNTITPSFQPETDIGKEFAVRLAEAFQTSTELIASSTRSKTLLKRFETLDEISGLVLFLCSEIAAAITGQNINVNCGLHTT